VALDLHTGDSGIIENNSGYIYKDSRKSKEEAAFMQKVKVIKKGEIKAAPSKAGPKVASKKAAAREMVSTVASWVSDLQQRKRSETAATLESFFTPSPAASRP